MESKQTATTVSSRRNEELRAALLQRRRELHDDLQGRIRSGRVEGTSDAGGDALDQTDASTRTEMELALLQMRGEMVTRIDEALLRLDAGKYGSCFQCDKHISSRRLNALPFAVRCQECEERRERTAADGRSRTNEFVSARFDR